ncbi:hypothetical protein SAMN04488505_1011406 [Chitinophaga rupis]|uniref:Uncharacterized protein n=1 Tax=Chitinophaga rupis TaxID=573321 RepID=A0A1H7M4X9_9BACT|nr:hypothetical protein [Chitinophaga rupis]SEL06340.1 hypothetical protein SAMN04488505_1011406 [Chitinophaga rupis]
MTTKNLARPALFMVILVVIVISSWEIYLRASGFTLSYDDAAPQWSAQRAQVYKSPQAATVFIGSSRIKYDLDIPTWKKLTGRDAVQLSIEGNSPVPVLLDLADDPGFHGRLVVDVTEPLFFSSMPEYNKEPAGNVSYYKLETPAQKAGYYLNHVLESQLVFLDKRFLSLNAQLSRLPVPPRPGVVSMDNIPFPPDFYKVSSDRQTYMDDRFVRDTAQQHAVQNIWAGFLNMAAHAPPPPPNMVPDVLKSVTIAVNKIRARGGQVVFVRTPSSGMFWDIEQKAFPREKLWNALLASTQCQGIHFMDYESTRHFICPEWSHLKPQDARAFTKALITLLPASFVKH